MEMLLIPILLVVMVVVVNLANGNIDGIAGGAYAAYPHLDDDEESGSGSMVNVGGTPMCGDVDCDGNPYGADDGLDYGFDNSGSVHDD